MYEVLGLVPSITGLKWGGGCRVKGGFIFSLPMCTTLQPHSLAACFLPVSLNSRPLGSYFLFYGLTGEEVLFSLGVLFLSLLICFKAGSHHIAQLGLRFLTLKQLFNLPLPSEVGSMGKHSVLKIC